MTITKDYEPFGAEWKREMKKWNKDMLIDLLRTKLIEIQQAQKLKQAHVKKSVCSDKFHYEDLSNFGQCRTCLKTY